MRHKYLVTLSTLLALVAPAYGSAQVRGGTVVVVRGGGARGAPAPAPDDIGDVSKIALRTIKLSKPQSANVKSLNKDFEAQEKELIRLASMVGGRARGARGGGPGGRGGGGGGAGGGGGGGRGGGSSVTPQLNDALFDLHAKFVAAVREVLTEEQRPVLDANLEAHEKWIQEQLDKAALRGRGRG